MANEVPEALDQNSDIVEDGGEGDNKQNTAAGEEGNRQNPGAVQGGRQQNVAAGVTLIERSLEGKIEKKEEEILKLEANVFQLANYYFVFQGVILTAMINGSSSGGLKCRYFFLPFSLSLIGFILNYGSLSIIAGKYKDSLDRLDDIKMTLYKRLDPEKVKNMSGTRIKREEQRQFLIRMAKSLFILFALLNLAATLIIPCFT